MTFRCWRKLASCLGHMLGSGNYGLWLVAIQANLSVAGFTCWSMKLLRFHAGNKRHVSTGGPSGGEGGTCPWDSGWTTEPRLNYGDDFLIFLDPVEWASGI
jgi:hypothetical protein